MMSSSDTGAAILLVKDNRCLDEIKISLVDLKLTPVKGFFLLCLKIIRFIFCAQLQCKWCLSNLNLDKIYHKDTLSLHKTIFYD